jgi:hypothetical protein
MLDLLSAPTETLTRAEKRDAIDAALLADPHRSDRDIARTLDCDHKTVSARRKEIVIPQSGGNISPLDRKISPAEPASLDPPHDGTQFDWANPGEDATVFPEQRKTAIYFNPDNELVIRQQNWPEDDSCIYIAEHMQQMFLDKLCDAMGIGSGP